MNVLGLNVFFDQPSTFTVQGIIIYYITGVELKKKNFRDLMLRPVPPEMERPLGAGRLGLSHWAGPSVTGSAGWSQKWYGGIIVDILAKESKFP